MGRIVTQSKLNELVGGTVDLGKGGGYCPTYKEIVDNWQKATSKIVATLSNVRFYYDGYADDSYVECTITLSEPAPTDLEIEVNFGSTPGAMNERVYVYLNEGETTITYKEGGFYLNEGYATIAAILDWEGYTTDVEPDGKTFRVGKYEKGYNTGIPYVDSSLKPKVTFKYPVKSDVSVTIIWQEEDRYGSILCNNYTTVVVKTGQTTAQGTAGWHCGGVEVGSPEITCIPHEDNYFIYE